MDAGGYRTAAVTDRLVWDVDLRQYSAGDGPCLTAFAPTAGSSRVGTTTEGAPDWPEFMVAAREVGIRSFLAAPICLGSEAVGSVNLYGLEPELFERTDESLIALVSGQAAIVVAHDRANARAVSMVGQLEEAMASRATIEQAKGILMARHRLTADEAFDRLRQESQRRNAKLRSVADGIVVSASSGLAVTE